MDLDLKTLMREVKVQGVNYVVLNWADVDSSLKELAAKIESAFEPSLIIGILRGGLMVANILADRLDVHNVRSVGCLSYTGIGEKVEPKIYQTLGSEEICVEDVLLVDDVADTGEEL